MAVRRNLCETSILVIVNASPWDSSLASAALRFTAAALASGAPVPAVFFRGDGVYNGQPGRMSDDGLAAPQARWSALGKAHDIELMLCSAASARRLPELLAQGLPAPFREAGLAEMFDLLGNSDRVVTF